MKKTFKLQILSCLLAQATSSTFAQDLSQYTLEQTTLENGTVKKYYKILDEFDNLQKYVTIYERKNGDFYKSGSKDIKTEYRYTSPGGYVFTRKDDKKVTTFPNGNRIEEIGGSLLSESVFTTGTTETVVNKSTNKKKRSYVESLIYPEDYNNRNCTLFLAGETEGHKWVSGAKCVLRGNRHYLAGYQVGDRLCKIYSDGELAYIAQKVPTKETAPTASKTDSPRQSGDEVKNKDKGKAKVKFKDKLKKLKEKLNSFIDLPSNNSNNTNSYSTDSYDYKPYGSEQSRRIQPDEQEDLWMYAIASDTIIKCETYWWEGKYIPDTTIIRYKNKDVVREIYGDGNQPHIDVKIHRNGGIFNGRVLKFPDGSQFQFYYFREGKDSSVRTYFDLYDLSYPELSLFDGVLTKADGTEVKYEDGRNKTEEDAKWAAIKAEEDAKWEAEKARKAAEKKEKYNRLCAQYGKKYADAAMEGSVIVGMPEKLMLQFVDASVTSVSGNVKWYEVRREKWAHVVGEKDLDVWNIRVVNGKVTSISHYDAWK